MILSRCLTCGKYAQMGRDGTWHHHGMGWYRDREHPPVVAADKKEWRIVGRQGTARGEDEDDPHIARTRKLNMHMEVLLTKTRFYDDEPVYVCDHIGDLMMERLLCGCARHKGACNGWLYSCFRHGGQAREPQTQNLQARAAREMAGVAA